MPRKAPSSSNNQQPVSKQTWYSLGLCGFLISTTAEGKKLSVSHTDQDNICPWKFKHHLGQNTGALLLGPVLTPGVFLRLHFPCARPCLWASSGPHISDGVLQIYHSFFSHCWPNTRQEAVSGGSEGTVHHDSRRTRLLAHGEADQEADNRGAITLQVLSFSLSLRLHPQDGAANIQDGPPWSTHTI